METNVHWRLHQRSSSNLVLITFLPIRHFKHYFSKIHFSILIIKPIRLDALISQIYFWNKTLHVSDCSSVHHQESSTVHTAMVQQEQDGVPSWSCSQAVSKPVWPIPLLWWKTPDDGQRNCPKHVEFYSKNKFEKLVHLAGFIIRIYHDTRSPERQIHLSIIPPCISKEPYSLGECRIKFRSRSSWSPYELPDPTTSSSFV